VIALTNDRPLLWNGSAWQPSWAWCCRYHDFADRAVQMLDAIETCSHEISPSFVQVWNSYEPAKHPKVFAVNDLPIFPGMCGRDSGNTIKDPKRVPYLKDCLRMGMQRVRDDQHVCLTRPETRIAPSAVLETTDAYFAYRLTRNSNGDTFAPIGDLFCARKSWWKAHLDEIPDLLFGGDYAWSECLRVLFQKYGGKDVTGICYREEKK
jgi:hypothetical protein